MLIAKVVNALMKRPAMNPWYWFAGFYGIGYLIGIFVGLAKSSPNLAYAAGQFAPITLIAVGLGIWRGRIWKAARIDDNVDAPDALR